MELKEYTKVIYRRLWIVVLTTLLAVASVAIVSYFFMDKLYEANASIYVGKQKSTQSGIPYSTQDLMLSQYLVKDYRELAKAIVVLQKVKEELKNDIPEMVNISEEILSKKISVENKNDTRFIAIKVQDKKPEYAAKIANKVAEVLAQKATELMKFENVEIVDMAKINYTQISPNPRYNISVAFFVGIMLGLGIIFIIEYFDNTIKTPDDVMKYAELNVIGAIPKMEELRK